MVSFNEDQRELEEELHETETESVGETAEGEGILGAIGNALGGLFGEEELGAHELHETGELGELGEVHELHESGELGELGELHELGELGELGELHESGEQFFGKLARGIGGLVKRAAPILKQVAKVAAPMVAKAVGGPFGGILSQLAGSVLGEEELHEQEMEVGELGEIGELGELGEQESEQEVAHEIASHESALHEALAEMMAEAAAQELNEGQAEAMIGAATVTVISPADRRALRRILPHLVRATAILTRILRRRRITRVAVRAVPTIMRRTVRSLKTAAASGKPITRALAGRAAAAQVRRVLGNPRACTAAIVKNVRASRRVGGPRRRAA